jgi:hypothetical protein
VNTTHPWINTNIRRRIGQKQRAHKKARKTKKKKDMDRYKRLKQKIQWEIRKTNMKYMEEVSTDSFRISALLMLSLYRNLIYSLKVPHLSILGLCF